MPVRKARSVADMKDSPWREPGDAELFRAIRQVWEFSERACQARFPPGVHRHRSADDMGDCETSGRKRTSARSKSGGIRSDRRDESARLTQS